MNQVHLTVLLLLLTSVTSFTFHRQFSTTTTTTTRIFPLRAKDEPIILYSDEEDSTSIPKSNRWKNLNPTIKQRIIQEGQQRAINNKKKREPAQDKKRRMMMYYKKAQLESKRQSRIERPLPIHSDERIGLKDIRIGEYYNGTVISLTNFGAYVDIGSQCDGLLHVSQISRDEFVEHPRQVFAPGDAVNVRVVRVSPNEKKMQLSMLPEEIWVEEMEESEEEMEERIPLEDLAPDDELWGEIRRVTTYGAYVELGAVVKGWLHFMDHPLFEYGKTSRDLMKVGDRIRCWVSNVNVEDQRLKLTCNRPKDLPGPRRELKKIF